MLTDLIQERLVERIEQELASAEPDGVARSVAALHEVRKAAKRLRYSAHRRLGNATSRDAPRRASPRRGAS